MVPVLLDGEEGVVCLLFNQVPCSCIIVIAHVHRVHTCIVERVVRLRIVKYMKKMLMT